MSLVSDNNFIMILLTIDIEKIKKSSVTNVLHKKRSNLDGYSH